MNLCQSSSCSFIIIVGCICHIFASFALSFVVIAYQVVANSMLQSREAWVRGDNGFCLSPSGQCGRGLPHSHPRDAAIKVGGASRVGPIDGSPADLGLHLPTAPGAGVRSGRAPRPGMLGNPGDTLRVFCVS